MEKKKIHKRKLKCASQAEILRSHQRDDEFVKHLREKLVDLLQMFARQSGFLRFTHSDIPFNLIYFAFTSGMGNQTLGEEYTGIVQANLKTNKVPTLTARILVAILECFGEKTLLHVLKRLQVRINQPHSELTPAAVAFLNITLSKLYTLVPIFILLHKGLFYLYGRYYSFGRRIVGVDYAKVYGSRPTDTVSWGLRLLGIATLMQCILKVWQNNNRDYTNKDTFFDEQHNKSVCQLCFESRSTTATPCGHLFCWPCISDWLNSKPQCPLCREYVTPSRIVHLMNL